MPGHRHAHVHSRVIKNEASVDDSHERRCRTIISDVIEFARPGPDDRDDVLNFWEATGGRATLRFDGLLNALF